MPEILLYANGVMMLEIERKFLLSKKQFDALQYQSSAILEETYYITQGYLVSEKDLTVRIRIDRRIGNKARPPVAILCIKKPVDGSHLVREEMEYEIPLKSAYGALDPLDRIYKTRYRFGEYTIDVFEDNLYGLIIAEKEYDSVEEAMQDEPPSWAGEEVTHDVKYFNSNLFGKKFINGTVA